MAASETIFKDIIELLKDHPRGLPVKEIADEIGMNRMSIARYLDVMRSSGQLDMIQFGHAKIYSLSNRVPVTDMLDYSSDIVLLLNQNKRVNYANKNFLTLIGKVESEIKGRHIYDILKPISDDDQTETLISKVFGGENRSDEIKLIDENEEHHFILNTIQTVFPDGNPGVTLFFKEIAGNEELFKKYKALDRLCSNFLMRTSDLVIFVDDTGIINYVNPGSYEILGIRPEEIAGRNVSDVFGCKNNKIEDCLSYLASCGDQEDTVQPFFFETEFLHAKGHFVPLHVSINPEFMAHERYCGYQMICSIAPFGFRRKIAVPSEKVRDFSGIGKIKSPDNNSGTDEPYY